MRGAAESPDWAEVQNVFSAVVALPEEQRAAYLSKQPQPIRAEVESLLAAYHRAGDFLGEEPEDEDRRPAGVKPGTQIGAYRIESVIGEGGMGVVYRAIDSRLNRPVAVKFLNADLAGAVARRRFQREAQMASSLNHPHILTVYDVGDFEGCQYLVTEFVDGGTLRDWMRAKPRTWREIVNLMTGVADGLASAHQAGILHRDIKPQNILVGQNGYAKLADFGLAKPEPRSTPEGLTQTIASHTTQPGMILGTLAYMSPEQAAGRPTDARSDIFSFGVLLYELLAGQRPFQAGTDLELLHTIIQGAARPLPEAIPLPLRMVVEKAIEKAPEERYQTARDMVVDLRRMSRQSADPAVTPSAAPVVSLHESRRAPGIGAAAVALMAVVLLAGGFLLWRSFGPAPQAPRKVISFEVQQPAGTIFAPPITRQPLAVSPDGSRLAFTATSANGTVIWIRDLASLEAKPLAGTDGAWSVFWTPDSRSIYFAVKRTLKQVNLETGSVRTVAELPYIPQLGTWRGNGDLLLYMGAGSTSELHPGDGSLREVSVDRGLRWPQFLPGRDTLIYSVYDGHTQRSHVAAKDYPDGTPATLAETSSRVQYAPPRRPGEPGYLLFVRSASLLAQAFDAGHLRLSGEPVPIAPNVIYYGPVLSANFSVSANGVLAYQAGFPDAELKWYNRRGDEMEKSGRPLPLWGQVRLSRDGKRVASTVWSAENGGTEIWVFDAAGKESRQLTFGPEVYRRPVWSPDGKRLAVGWSPIVGGPQLAILDVTSGKAEPFADPSAKHLHGLPTDWSPDGQFIVFEDGIGEEVHEVWLADLTSNRFVPLFQNKFPQWGTAFSPDGRQIAFVSMESGRPEVYLQGFDAAPSPHVVGDRRQVSRDGAWLVRWDGSSRELFYVGLDNTLYAVKVTGPVAFGEPERLFRIPGVPQYGTTRDFQFDVSPDGQRFITPTTGSVPPPPFIVIENWQDRFRR